MTITALLNYDLTTQSHKIKHGTKPLTAFPEYHTQTSFFSFLIMLHIYTFIKLYT